MLGGDAVTGVTMRREDNHPVDSSINAFVTSRCSNLV